MLNIDNMIKRFIDYVIMVYIIMFYHIFAISKCTFKGYILKIMNFMLLKIKNLVYG